MMWMVGDWTYGLVVGDKVYRRDGDKGKIAPYDGKNAKVTGEESGAGIGITSIAQAK
jgi:hypothetical protein